KTATGGEIDALDPGGFGALTITKAITLNGQAGMTSVLVAGTNGIVVQAGANDVVVLRAININGINSGFNGIRFLSGKALYIEDCEIFGFTVSGIDIQPSATAPVFIVNSRIHDNGTSGAAVDLNVQGNASVSVVSTMFGNTTNGLYAHAGTG